MSLFCKLSSILLTFCLQILGRTTVECITFLFIYTTVLIFPCFLNTVADTQKPNAYSATCFTYYDSLSKLMPCSATILFTIFAYVHSTSDIANFMLCSCIVLYVYIVHQSVCHGGSKSRECQKYWLMEECENQTCEHDGTSFYPRCFNCLC